MRALALFVLFSAMVVPAQVVKTIVSSGPSSNRYDVVILGDGYVAAEQSKFDQDCTTFAAALFAREPYQTFAGYFNVHTVFRASNQSGADEPDLVPPVFKDTAYDATFNYGNSARCLYIQNQTRANQDAMLAPATEGRVIVLVNHPRYGGCGGVFSVSYNGSAMNEVQIHELGHSVGGLADEYDYPYSTYAGSEPAQANITKSATGQKWAPWLGFSGISAFQGAGYYLYGLYRPRIDCLMRTLGIQLCPVCQEQLVLRAHEAASPIDAPQPTAAIVNVTKPNPQKFSFTNIAPATSNALVTWRVDGIVQSSGVGVSSYTFDSPAWSPTSHTVNVEVLDRNPLVRSDPSGLLRKTKSWVVNVSDPAGVDLEVTLVQPSAAAVVTGGALDVHLAETNHGTSPAATHQVELFLSQDQVIDASDVYLGSTQVQGLGSGGLKSWTRSQVQIPPHVPPGSWWIAGYADREDAVGESNEGNNVKLAPLTLLARGCSGALAYRDALNYPSDAATLPALTGGKVRPTISAPCDPLRCYVVVWGGSGTSPGLALPGGLVLPLNYDLLSQISLNEINSPIFAAFYGTLDTKGSGFATFGLPGGVLAGGLATHFAAVVFDPLSGLLVRVTNPIALAIP